MAATAAGDTVTDYYEDIIEPDELEQAAYNFVQFYREGGEMHERGGCAVLVESVIFTKEKWQPWASRKELSRKAGGLALR